jgi:mRNA interferase RelE/StbE
LKHSSPLKRHAKNSRAESGSKTGSTPLRYTVYLSSAAARDISSIQPSSKALVEAFIASLSITPRPHGTIKLSGSDGYRYRIGDLRVLYLIDDSERRVLVARVKDRNERTYKDVARMAKKRRHR